MAGPAHVRQLTFDTEGPAEEINEFVVGSPDGKYFGLQHSEDRDGIKWNLYTIDVETRKVERLTHDEVEDKHPQYTPDGHVAFHSTRGATRVTLEGGQAFDAMNLWSLDPRTGALAKLTTSLAVTSAYGLRDNRHVWISPDGSASLTTATSSMRIASTPGSIANSIASCASRRSTARGMST